MKLEIKKLIEAFIRDNNFMRHVIIHNKEDNFCFPESMRIETKYFDALFRNILKVYKTDAQFAVITNDNYLFVIKENDSIYLCECGRDASLSQIKMEFCTLVEDVKKQWKTKPFFKSIFDW
ncbi:MAG: hypothetical protein ABIJ31_14860 [Pseudomonadota bacterium]